MGIIQKQTIKGSIFSYLGVVIGYLNVVILMPQFFTTSQVGLTQLLLSFSAIFSTIGALGFNGVINRLFPYFRDKEKAHNGFPFLIIITGLTGFLTLLIAFLVLKPTIIESNIQKSPLFVEYLYFLIPLIFFRLFFILLDGYNKVLLDAVTGTLWSDFGYKILNFLFIILYSIEYINFRQYMFGFTFAVCFPTIPVLYKLTTRGNFKIKPHLNFLNKNLIKEMATISLFGLMGTSSGILVNSIDKIMVNEYLSLGATGIFSICALFSTIIRIPFVSLTKISTPILAEAWKNNDHNELLNNYQKSSINQLTFASLIVIGIVGNLDNIFRILPAEYEQGRYVIVIYSLAFLIMTSGGTGGFIIGTSPKYKVQTYFMFLTSLLTIGLNMLFIPVWGMNGAAIATLITYIISTLFRVLYLKYNMNLFPYNYKHILTLVISVISFIPALLIRQLDSLILDISIRSLLITIIFGSLVLAFNVSEEITGIYKSSIESLKRIIYKQ